MNANDQVTMKKLLQHYSLEGVLQGLATLCEESGTTVAAHEIADQLKELSESENVAILGYFLDA